MSPASAIPSQPSAPFAPPPAPAATQLHPPESPVALFVAAGTHCPSGVHTLGSAQSATDPQCDLHVPLGSQLYGVQSTDLPSAPIALCPLQLALAGAHVLSAPHEKPLVQSAFVAHDVLHAVAPHTYGEQAFGEAALHVPCPSQLLVCAEPVEHDGVPHDVVSGGYLHVWAFAPSHVPPHSLPAFVHAGRVPLETPCGSPATGEQTPLFEGRSHASHCPLHARSQQKPSAHALLLHSLLALQTAPGSFFPVHRVAEQYAVDAQSLSLAQVSLHATPAASHRFGAQSAVDVWQVPPPLHKLPLTFPEAQVVLPVAPHPVVGFAY
jgi:hypothetical protein